MIRKSPCLMRRHSSQKQQLKRWCLAEKADDLSTSKTSTHSRSATPHFMQMLFGGSCGLHIGPIRAGNGRGVPGRVE